MPKNNIDRYEARQIAKKLVPMLINQLAGRIMDLESSKLAEYTTAEDQFQAADTRRRNALADIFDAITR
jgi:hypothetical protein